MDLDVGLWTPRDHEICLCIVVSLEMPLPYKLLGTGTNITLQRSCPGRSKEAEVRTITGLFLVKGQL